MSVLVGRSPSFRVWIPDAEHTVSPRTSAHSSIRMERVGCMLRPVVMHRIQRLNFSPCVRLPACWMTPFVQVRCSGPDAGLLARILTRDISKIGVVSCTAPCVMNRATCLMTARLHAYRISIFAVHHPSRVCVVSQHSRGFDVHIEDTTNTLCGWRCKDPRTGHSSRHHGPDMDRMSFSHPPDHHRGLVCLGVQNRHTGDLGYEIFCENEHALPLWDAIVAAGQPHGMLPIGLMPSMWPA